MKYQVFKLGEKEPSRLVPDVQKDEKWWWGGDGLGNNK